MRPSCASWRRPPGDAREGPRRDRAGARERLDIAEIELDEPRADEILVRMVAVGIGHTDLRARDQHVPVQLPMVGTCGFDAGSDTQLTLPLMTLLYRGRSLRGVMGGDGPATLLLPRLIALHERGHFPFHHLVRHYPFARLNEAMADARAGAAIKPVLIFDP